MWRSTRPYPPFFAWQLFIVMSFALASCGVIDDEPTHRTQATPNDVEVATSSLLADGSAEGFATRPYAWSYLVRRHDFVDLTLDNALSVADPSSSLAIPDALILISASDGELSVDEAARAEAAIRGSLARINERRDGADFSASSLVRLLHLVEACDDPVLEQELVDDMRAALLGFKFWPDEPGIDDMAFQTENHYINFAASGYLSALLYPDQVFTNTGDLGGDRVDAFRARVLRWLELRFETGFSEWLSNDYYSLDVVALTNLVDFAGDAQISTLAAQVLDLLLADMALHHFEGAFASTHGRVRKDDRTDALGERTGSIFKLMFGLNEFRAGDRATVHLALSDYAMPRVLFNIAADRARRPVTVRQQMGIRIEEAQQWGLTTDPNDADALESGMLLMTLEAYAAPETIDLFYTMLNAFNWWENGQFAPFAQYRDLLDFLGPFGLLRPFIEGGPLPEEIAAVLAALGIERANYVPDVSRNLRTAVNIYTHRTRDYMLSTAQNWRAGFGGDQQSIAQAVLGPDTIVFSTHPASPDTGSSGLTPSYWNGYARMPQAVQVENVGVEIYNIDPDAPYLYVPNAYPYTHVFFPTGRFDEVVEEGGWIFGRVDRGYIALWSGTSYVWQPNPDDDVYGGTYELIVPDDPTVPNVRSVLVTEMGRERDYGSFEAFRQAIIAAPIEVSADYLAVTYTSPSQGELTVEWGADDPLTQDGVPVDVANYPRYDSPYGYAEFPGQTICFRFLDEWLELDFENGTREASSYLGRWARTWDWGRCR